LSLQFLGDLDSGIEPTHSGKMCRDGEGLTVENDEKGSGFSD